MLRIHVFQLFALLLVVSDVFAHDSDDIYHPRRSHASSRSKRAATEQKVVDPEQQEQLKKFLEDLDHDSIRHPIVDSIESPSARLVVEDETDPGFWKEKSAAELTEALKQQKLNTNVAKNVIIMLGDGMGLPSITAGRILKGQLSNMDGASSKLAMDSLPHTAISKTYNVDAQVPDSAGTATAFMSGVKTDSGVLGINAGVIPGVCSTKEGNEVDSILTESHREGKSVGIVTTTRLNHATPASAYSHSPYRYWYGDADLPQEAVENGCRDIAFQLYENLPNIEVALGGGRTFFKPNGTTDETGTSYYREDGQNLIEKWQNNMDDMGRTARYVTTKLQMDDVDPLTTDHLWGMFTSRDMSYDIDRKPDEEPSLAEMTQKAIEVLQKNENGFFLLIEGGRIDHAHHGTNAYRALTDMLAFDAAVQKVLDMTSSDDTLLVVTADHSHTFTFGGYAARDNPLFGLAPSNWNPERALDLKYYTSLLYGNGEGYQGDSSGNPELSRQNVTAEMTGEIDYLQQTAVPKSSETHGGDDVSIHASGPMAHLFHTVHEQSYIAHVMRYASCVGGYNEHCADRKEVVVEKDEVQFLGNTLDKGATESALYALFSLNLIVALCIVGGFVVFKKK